MALVFPLAELLTLACHSLQSITKQESGYAWMFMLWEMYPVLLYMQALSLAGFPNTLQPRAQIIFQSGSWSYLGSQVLTNIHVFYIISHVRNLARHINHPSFGVRCFLPSFELSKAFLSPCIEFSLRIPCALSPVPTPLKALRVLFTLC